jgi:hypothetical protein
VSRRLVGHCLLPDRDPERLRARTLRHPWAWCASRTPRSGSAVGRSPEGDTEFPVAREPRARLWPRAQRAGGHHRGVRVRCPIAVEGITPTPCVPITLGHEIAGTVTAVGDAATGLGHRRADLRVPGAVRRDRQHGLAGRSEKLLRGTLAALQRVLGLVASGQLPPSSSITRTSSLDGADRALETLHESTGDPQRVVVATGSPPSSQQTGRSPAPRTPTLSPPRPPARGVARRERGQLRSTSALTVRYWQSRPSAPTSVV